MRLAVAKERSHIINRSIAARDSRRSWTDGNRHRRQSYASLSRARSRARNTGGLVPSPDGTMKDSFQGRPDRRGVYRLSLLSLVDDEPWWCQAQSDVKHPFFPDSGTTCKNNVRPRARAPTASTAPPAQHHEDLSTGARRLSTLPISTMSAFPTGCATFLFRCRNVSIACHLPPAGAFARLLSKTQLATRIVGLHLVISCEPIWLSSETVLAPPRCCHRQVTDAKLRFHDGSDAGYRETALWRKIFVLAQPRRDVNHDSQQLSSASP